MSITPAMKHFMGAAKFVVIGRVMTDPGRHDHKVSVDWYGQGRVSYFETRFDDLIRVGVRCSNGMSLNATVLPDQVRWTMSVS